MPNQLEGLHCYHSTKLIFVSGQVAVQFAQMDFPWKLQKTCLGALFYGNQLAALQNCNINTIKLPVTEKAKNLGNGNWHIISATEQFDMYLSEMRDTNPLNRKKLDGCKACVMELECGTKIETRLIEISADMASCKNDSIMRVDVKLTKHLRYLFSKVSSLNEMPHIATESQACQQIIEKVQLKMTTNSDYYRKSFDQLNELTTPIVEDLKIIRPNLSCCCCCWG